MPFNCTANKTGTCNHEKAIETKKETEKSGLNIHFYIIATGYKTTEVVQYVEAEYPVCFMYVSKS